MSDTALRFIFITIFAYAPLSHGIMQQRRSYLPICQSVLDKLPYPQVTHIRKLAMEYTYQHRRAHEYSMYKDKKLHPPTEEGEQWAYNTTLSLQEIEVLEQQHQQLKDRAQAEIEQQQQMLQAAGMLPQHVPLTHLVGCVLGQMNPHAFPKRPQVSFMLEFYKRPYIIEKYIEALRGCDNITDWELVVNVDSPQDAEAWANASRHMGGRVLPVISTNIHEIRAFNRMAGLSRGDILIVSADDDYYPANCSWLGDVVTLFDNHPHVGLIGLRGYIIYWMSEFNGGAWYEDPASGIETIFAQKVDMAPMALRASAYKDVGGFDETLAEPGECGIVSDWEICYRMWAAGWEVMGYRPLAYNMVHEETPGGTHVPETNMRCWHKQHNLLNEMLNIRRDVDFENDMVEAARVLNNKRLRIKDPTVCPYKDRGGCTE